MTKTRTLVKSLARLYESGKVTVERIDQMVRTGAVTADEFEIITGQKYYYDEDD